MSIREAFQQFMDKDFESAAISSTKASWGGSGYSVELFDDSSYRVLWDNNIGNMYDSPGLILSIPALQNDDWDEDPELCFFDNAKDYLLATFEEHSLANLNTQFIVASQEE